MEDELIPLFASTMSGAEEALCDELRDLGFQSVRLNRGGIPFRGTWEDGWRACLECRVAVRIQALMGRFPATTPEDLYDGIRGVDWTPFITPDQTISIDSVCMASEIRHSGFATLKTKDAIVDQVRDKFGERPSVSKDDPDVRVFLYLANDKASIYLDLAGESLHRRGYRKEAGEAPLRETLAAAMLRLAGWDCAMPLIDPMCGSGTIPIEAAMWASNKAPGLTRDRFGFERWANFDEDAAQRMRELRGSLRGQASGKQPKIQASDKDGDVLEIAKANARTAGVRIGFRERPLSELQCADTRTFVIFNPPYGKRLEAEETLVREVASAVSKSRRCRVAVLAGSEEYERSITLRPEKRIPLKNGDIDCVLLVYEVP